MNEMNNSPKLYLVPSPLGENPLNEVLPTIIYSRIEHISHFAVEEVRTARRFLSRLGFKGRIDSLKFYTINEHSSDADIEAAFAPLAAGNDMALISEAGLPAVADPGALLVAKAHRNDIEVVPFVGPSSLMMALMASGMNGQSFAFAGYIPVKRDERKKRVKELESRSAHQDETEILIETPYRNDSLFADILEVCNSATRVCVAVNITMPDQFIKTKTVAQWRKFDLKIDKRPCVFLIYAR